MNEKTKPTGRGAASPKLSREGRTMKPLTRAQRIALLSVYHRDWGHFERPSYLQWRRSARRMIGDETCILVEWCNMWVGIEVDGYTHT